MNLRNKTGLSYDDVLLVPALGLVKSRTEIDTTTALTCDKQIRIPIVAAPMSSVTNARVANKISRLGGAAFIHRNQRIIAQMDEWDNARSKNEDADSIGCAIGITEPYEDRFLPLYNHGCRLFCLDIAHAHSVYTEKWFESIPTHMLDSVDWIIGSVATGEAVEWFLSRFNVGAFRVGIGPGAACTTREKTGHGFPQLSAVAECAEVADSHLASVPIIADGGINTAGDIVKALAAGASSVMIGRLLAGSEEAPHPGSYYGMASERAKKESGYSHGFTEGIEATIKVEGPLENIIESLMNGIKSGISYSGAKSILDLQMNHEFIRVAHGVAKESGVRV